MDFPAKVTSHLRNVILAGVLAGANKLAQVAYLRRDVLLAPLLAIKRIGSQSNFSRFFQGFSGAGANLHCFGSAWHWCLDRLRSRPGGYTLDLDSTRLLASAAFDVAVGERPMPTWRGGPAGR